MAAFGIAGVKAGGLKRLFMTHPPLEERIAALGQAHPESAADVALMNGFLAAGSEKRGIVR